MTNNQYDDRPRIYINWQRVRPTGWRGWAYAVGIAAAHGLTDALVALPLSLAVAMLFALVTGAVQFGRVRGRRAVSVVPGPGPSKTA